MNKRILSAEERRLAVRLRCEAIESRPAFSESLHRRIVEAVNCASGETRQNAPAASVIQDKALFRRTARRTAISSAAACLLLGLGIAGWRLAAPPRQNAMEQARIAAQSQADLLAFDEWADQATAGLDRLAASVALAPQAGHLEHDARLAALALLERLPVNAEMMEAVAVDDL